MAVNASEVARLYSTDLSGVDAASNRFYDNLQRQQMFDKQQQLQRDRLSADLVSDAFKPLQQASGTYYDQYVSQRLPQIQKSYLQFMKTNPNVPLSQQQMFLNNEIGSLGQQIQAAKMFQPKLQDYLTRVEKEMPYLNQLAVRDAVNKATFFDEKGEPLPAINPASLDSISAQLADPNDITPYVDAAQLNNYLGKTIKEGYAPQGFSVPMKDSSNIGYNLKGTMFPYQRVNPKTGEVELATENITIGDQALPALTKNVYSQVGQNTLPFKIYGDALRSNLMSKYPGFESIEPEVQDRIVNAEIFNRFGERKPTTAPTKDYDEFNAQMRKRQFEATERQRAIQNRMAQERLDRGKKPKTDFDVVTEGLLTDKNTGKPLDENSAVTIQRYTTDLNPKAYAALINAAPPIKAFLQNVPTEQLSTVFSPIDISASTPKGFITDKKTLGKKKLYAIPDPTSGEIYFLTQKLKREKVGDSFELVPDEESYEVIAPSKAKNFLSTISRDFGVKEGQFADDFSGIYENENLDINP